MSFRVLWVRCSKLSPNSKFLVAAALFLATVSAPFRAQEPISYTFSFPEPHRRWMQVEATFPSLGPDPLELRMSVSSPGRYSSHDFAKNVYDVDVTDAAGSPLEPTRPDAHGWRVSGHGGVVTVRYKVFGDRLDGTYLAIDSSHAHINMPAALVWARGLEDRPVTLTFERPPDRTNWQIATQLFPGATSLEYTAPNLQYLMDSPVEFGPGKIREFDVDGKRIRFALHHQHADAELEGFLQDVERIVRVQGRIFGEYPDFEPGHYTFLADYLPSASGDGMEHRNSTVVTSPTGLANDRLGLLDTVSHEFFHAWNIERIRPESLEPFDFERTNVSGELWLGEGFTQYYGILTLARAGLQDVARTAARLNVFIASAESPARTVRSPVEMSQMAPFVDGSPPIDPTNWTTTFISYYSGGAAIALALDLTLRSRTDGAISLDDYMRALWREHGVPDGRPGYVPRPYTLADAEARLAEVSRDAAFARDFFAKFVHGSEMADYASLVEHAGFVLQRARPGRAWIGDLRLDRHGPGLRLTAAPALGSPAHLAGLAQDDELREIEGVSLLSSGDLTKTLARLAPGQRVTVRFVDRTGETRTSTVVLEEDPARELVPVERAGGTLTEMQRRFRAAWLN